MIIALKKQKMRINYVLEKNVTVLWGLTHDFRIFVVAFPACKSVGKRLYTEISTRTALKKNPPAQIEQTSAQNHGMHRTEGHVKLSTLAWVFLEHTLWLKNNCMLWLLVQAFFSPQCLQI